ncbi:hypothetical protein QFC21_000926 [Naganishia friedmannii]|uniref:Uncharacterized protein n=1 Tax=Naganishia friedmannii TaxID=89922 RepID=A0ACC2W7Q3_9TREE|nr:hypothetical protein QFC21_000926 [Naganishia friedmannii]
MDIPQASVPTSTAIGRLGGTPPVAEEANAFGLSRLSSPHTELRQANHLGHGSTHPLSAPSAAHHAHFDLPPGEPKDTDESLPVPVIDIEHAPVEDDPREWSDRKKTLILAMIAIASISPTLGASIYNPAFDELRAELHATDTQLALSLSIFILFQGGFPYGQQSLRLRDERRVYRVIYLASNACFITGTIVAGRANSMTLLIVMRLVQAFGSSAVLAIGAGSLADIYERHERGSKWVSNRPNTPLLHSQATDYIAVVRMGLYYAVPLLGPSLGPVIGGLLTKGFSWRATFYFLAAFGGVSFCSFLFFPDSFRKERSQLYQVATQRALKRALAHHEVQEKKRRKKSKGVMLSSAPTPATTVPPTPALRTGFHTPEAHEEHTLVTQTAIASQANPSVQEVGTPTSNELLEKEPVHQSVDNVHPVMQHRHWKFWQKAKVQEEDENSIPVRLSLKDVNPLPAMWHILKRPNNFLGVVCSGGLFAVQYTIAFTGAVLFAEPPYNYSALKVGLALLSFGGGNVVGSILGGRYSDIMLRRLKKKNGGVGEPEMRLASTTPAEDQPRLEAMFIMLPSLLVYAWTANFKTNVAGPLIALFFNGFSIM